jgi:cobalamin biosynthesis protein CobT
MSFDKNRARATLDELLELSGIKPELFEDDQQSQLDEIEPDYIEENLSEAEDEEEREKQDPEIPEPKAVGKKRGEPEEAEEEEEPEDKEEPEEKEEDEEELHDTWEISIKTGGKFKFEMYENYFYVWYRNKKSERIEIPAKFKAMRKELARLVNKIMTYVEKAS